MTAELNIRPFLAVLNDYSGFKLTENGSVSFVENDCCLTCHKVFAYHFVNLRLAMWASDACNFN